MSQGTAEKTHELILLSFSNGSFSFKVHSAITIVIMLLVVVLLFKKYRDKPSGQKISKVTLNFPLGGGSVEMTPCHREKQIAHQIWTELVTRKAAIPFNDKEDVIVEVYNSWYELFKVIRSLIREIPIEKLSGNEKENVNKIINSSISILNQGLRPHLTTWQSKYRYWYDKEVNNHDHDYSSPQELQEAYPQYRELVLDLKQVNIILMDYSNQLEKLAKA